MTDYVKSTNFAAKDALSSGNPAKLVKGTEIDTEFNNIATAVATKENTANKGVANGYAGLDSGGVLAKATQYAQTAYLDSAANFTVSLQLSGSSVITSGGLLTAMLAVDGSGSGLDADLLDGLNSTAFCKTANNLSDVTASSARTNLGVTATGADTTYCYRANNLSDVTASTARANLAVPSTSITISVSGTGLSGGGDLSANRTITIDQAAMTTRNISNKGGVTKTLSTSAASGGSDGDIWYRY